MWVNWWLFLVMVDLIFLGLEFGAYFLQSLLQFTCEFTELSLTVILFTIIIWPFTAYFDVALLVTLSWLGCLLQTSKWACLLLMRVISADIIYCVSWTGKIWQFQQWLKQQFQNFQTDLALPAAQHWIFNRASYTSFYPKKKIVLIFNGLSWLIDWVLRKKNCFYF